MEELGYNNYWKVISAKFCGVPQNRERVFCVSIRKDVNNGMFGFEQDFDNGVRLKDILEDEVDEKYYLSDEMIKGLIDTIKEKGYKNPEISNCLTTVQKDSLVVEAKIKQIGNIVPTSNFNNPQRGRIYSVDGISPSLDCCGGGGREPKILELGLINENRQPKILVKEVTNCDKAVVEPKIIKLAKESGNHYGGGLYSKDGISPTLVSSGAGRGTNNIPKILELYRIRKLTPTEYFRLMGVSDEDIVKIQSTIVNGKLISNSQQYKLAGNSIVVNCMEFLKNFGTVELSR